MLSTVTTTLSLMTMLSFCFLLETNMGRSFFLGSGSSVRKVGCQPFRFPSYQSTSIPLITWAKNKKADMAENPKVFGHVGLLFNEPFGKAELLFI
jgi:hypothetical protein